MSELFPSLFPDSDIAKGFTSKTTKCAAIIDSVIAGSFKKDLAKEIRQAKYYSLIIDESTDISTESVMAIMVKYFDTSEQGIATFLLGLPALKGQFAADMIEILGDKLKTYRLDLSDCGICRRHD